MRDSYSLQVLLRAVWKFAHEEYLYTAAVRSTPTGRQSDDLRRQAKEQKDQGHIETSYRLYEDALRLHAAADDGAAAAGARHDLAEILTDRRLGMPVENFLRAESLYRRTQQSAERERFPSRSAMTKASLASCLRGLAAMPRVNFQQEREWLDEAQELLRQATSLDDAQGEPGLPALIEHLNTLANLHGQRDQLDKAARITHRIEDKCGQFAYTTRLLRQALELRLPPPLQVAVAMVGELFSLHEKQRPMIILNAAKLYLERSQAGHPNERARAVQLLQRLVADAPMEWSDRARLCLAEALLDEGNIEQARSHLNQIKQDSLPNSFLPKFANGYARAGMSDVALGILHEIIDRCIQERRDAETDHASDSVALRAQVAADQAAVLLADCNEAISAFLALENVSGMRFEEHVLTYSFRPRTSLGYQLWIAHRSYAHAAATLFRFASQSVYLPDEHRSEYWEKIFESFSRETPTVWPGMPGQTEAEKRAWNQFISTAQDWTYTSISEDAVRAKDIVKRHMVAAAAAADPAAEIGRRAQALIPGVVALKQALAEVEGERFLAYARGQSILTKSTLQALLTAYPDYIFVRLTVAQDGLVAASVFLTESTLTGRVCRFALPKGLYKQLELVREHPSHANIAELTEALASLDISAVLPSNRPRRIVLLPSWFASFLPLGSIGPKGRMPIDLCDGLLWLPCLAPLRCPQAPLPPRHGLLSVAPINTPSDGGTRLHDYALGQPLIKEERLRGADADLLAVTQRAPTVRAICFYTHGCHESEELDGPHIALADGRLHHGYLDGRWLGMERVELWACQSGVNLPHDPLTPPGVAEGFGLDVEFLKVGVRSTIGTLWPVWEVVTASILWRYRTMLANGADAPAALVAAQRFWRDEALETLLREFAAPGTPAQRLQRFWNALGMPPAQHINADAVMAALGASNQSTMIETIRERFGNPTAWGGFRFMGCPEAVSSQTWDDTHLRPLNEEDRRSFHDILKQVADLEEHASTSQSEVLAEDAADEPGEEALHRALSHGLDHDSQLEGLLIQSTNQQKSEPISAEQALRVARLYRDRVQSSHLHNLLLGLAWLHEALADPGLSERQRVQLRVEAAHLWFDVAQGEAVTAFDYYFGPANPVALERGHRLVATPGTQDTFDGRVAHARLIVLQSLRLQADAPDPLTRLIPREAVERAWQSIAGELTTSLAQTYENRRGLACLCELLAMAPETVADGCKQALALAQQLLETECPREEWPSLLRLAAAYVWLAERADHQLRPMKLEDISRLTPCEAVRMTGIGLRDLADEGWFAGESQKTVMSHVMSRLETALWGPPSGDRYHVWHTHGNAGAGYRHAVAGFLGGHPEKPPLHQHAAHLLGATHLLCDLRLKILNRTVRGHLSLFDQNKVGSQEKADIPRLPPLWMDAYHREQVLLSLSDSALLGQVDQQGVAAPHDLDPFCLPLEELGAHAMERNRRSADCLTGFELERACDKIVFQEPQRARTAAFYAARVVERLTRSLDEEFEHIQMIEREVTKELAEDSQSPISNERKSPTQWLYNPELLIKDWEKRLRELHPGQAVLGLCMGAADKLIAMVCWRSEQGADQNVVHSKLGLGMQVRASLAMLLGPIEEDFDEHRGRSGRRREALERLQSALAPLLEEVLRPVLSQQVSFDLAILTPGPLRTLPLFALRAGADLLTDRFNSLRHLPALGWWGSEENPPERPWTTCLFSPCMPADGETTFGEAAIYTLRAAFPPQCKVDPPDVSMRTIVEVDRIEETADQFECLRLYGVGASYTANHATAAIVMAGTCRALGVHNVYMPLTRCETVELWAATGAVLATEVLHDRSDRVPGLAYHYLACGAASVLDLAWPVFDLVKALVCERYGLLRRCGLLDGACALAEAVTQVRELLRVWRETASRFANVRAALSYLDAGRRQALQELGLESRLVVPFAPRADTPSLAKMFVSDLISEACQPAHLAAFRFWGGL
jgi:hypothetical protein